MSTIFQALDVKAGLIPGTAGDPASADGATGRGRPLADPASRIRTAPIQLAESSPLLPYDGSSPRAGEQYRTVRTGLLQNPDAPRVLVVSSCGSGDGKTLSAVNTAGALAMKGETTVLLVDADLRKPGLASALGLPEEPGLAGVLHGDCQLEDAILQTAQFPNLFVLPAGQARRNPAELLDSARWHQLCAVVRKSFRFVLIDTPPIAVLTDYDLVQAVADGVIFVVRPDHSDRNLCLAALEKVNATGKLTGVLVNCAENWFLYKRYGRYPYPEELSAPAGTT
ncbi:MAG TPA: CpsD/CapB family tyrosine-protein kinase [Bryobacteraceae bacterium]|nr:CpsD/CapB family tyrosine-protein kinase [Bryobacteraceae bacterium]